MKEKKEYKKKTAMEKVKDSIEGGEGKGDKSEERKQ